MQDTVPRRLATLKRLFPVRRFRGWFLACGGVLLIGLAAWAVGTAYIYLQPGGYPVREHGPDGAGLVIGLGFVMVWFLSGALFAGCWASSARPGWCRRFDGCAAAASALGGSLAAGVGLVHQQAVARVRPARREAGRGAGTPSQRILELQRVVGNQAVGQLLVAQRAPAVLDVPPSVPVTGPLSAEQVRRAKGFYAAQPGRYTPTIISQIQSAVGTEATGKISDADVQAVANKQVELNVNASPALKIDGMAGPRTLPQVFKFGLANDASVSDYTNKARARFANPNGKSERDIAKEIVESEILPKLTSQGIPPFKFSIVNDLGTRGAFSNADWELKLDDLQFQPGDKHDLKETTATIYHEARHAEQDFRIGRMLAGQGKTPEQINDATGLNLDVAKKAKDLPLAPGSMEALIADEWNESLNSPAALEKRRRNSAELKAAFKAREAARKANAEHPSPANAAKQAAAEARFDKAVAEHDDLAFEFDAERLETKVRQQF